MSLVSYEHYASHSKCVSHANHASNACIRNHATCKSVKSQESLEINVGISQELLEILKDMKYSKSFNIM